MPPARTPESYRAEQKKVLVALVDYFGERRMPCTLPTLTYKARKLCLAFWADGRDAELKSVLVST